MAIDFGAVPFPDSPMYEYFERRFSGSAGKSIASSPLSGSPINEKALHSRLLELELAEKQRATSEVRYTDDADEMASFFGITVANDTSDTYTSGIPGASWEEAHIPWSLFLLKHHLNALKQRTSA